MFRRSQPSLEMFKDLNFSSEPLKKPTRDSPRILVVGGGVIGLVTAWVLLDKGYKVTILSRDWATFDNSKPRLTSQIAGALWEYPPAVCGSHTDKVSIQHAKRWCMVAYHIWAAIAQEQSIPSGVRMLPADFFFTSPIEQDAKQYSKMKEIKASGVHGFIHDSGLVKLRNTNPEYGAVDAYEHLAPVIDTDVAMGWLMNLVKSKGAQMQTGTVKQDLLLVEDELRLKYKAQIIVNATGLGSEVLADDKSCYPLRGALIRVKNDGKRFPKVNAALTISADAAHDSNGIVFLVPRNDDTLVIGGIAQPNEYTTDLTLDSPVIKRMRERCEKFLPGLEKAELDAEYPFAQGLRPTRTKNVRVERELRQRKKGGGPSHIIHNYGHCGSGWSLSFGCAADVAVMVEEALAEQRPCSMAMAMESFLNMESFLTMESFLNMESFMNVQSALNTELSLSPQTCLNFARL